MSAGTGGGRSSTISTERLEVARTMVHRHVESGASPSTTAIVAHRGEIILHETAGIQGPHGAPLEPDHVWPVASAGKPITAAVVMALVEDGVLAINEPATRWLPELAGHDDVLVHHLLTHTAGWESAQQTHRLEKSLEAGEVPDVDLDRDPVTRMFLGMALDPVVQDAPGERMAYDNGYYVLLSEIIRRATGDTFDRIARERIFEPLGMEHSAVCVGPDLEAACVTRAPGLPFGPDSPLTLESDWVRGSDDGASGIHTSAPDLSRFGQMILEGGQLDGARVLSPASVLAMTTNRVPGVPALFAENLIREASWGYGFTIVQPIPFAYFVGGLVPDGACAHPGAGGTNYWIDFHHDIVGVWFEVVTEMTEFFEPVSGVGHRFMNAVTASVLPAT